MIRAEFVGKTSCGFKVNHVYCLKVSFGQYNCNPVLWIEDIDKTTSRCPYYSLEAFLKKLVNITI